MVMGIEIEQVFCMKQGTDEASYATSSYIQRQVLTMTKPMKERAIRECYWKGQPSTLCIADLGCSSAELNTLNLVSELIDTVEKARGELQNKRGQEYQVYLNDLPGNDFNTIFRSLSKFGKQLKERHCFVNGVPGSFYGRLFPSNHLHFVHSSYSLHWLSQIPEGVEDNKGNIYIAERSPPSVLKAYSEQFEKDFSTFLRCRSEELVAGGCMVLTVVGRRSRELYSKDACHAWDLLAKAMMDMVEEGLIEEEKLNGFNIPEYPPSAEEMEALVEKEGSFELSEVDVSEVNWECKESSNGLSHYEFSNCVRSVGEPLLKTHFSEDIVEEIFQRYKDHVQASMAIDSNVFVNVTVTLTKKA